MVEHHLLDEATGIFQQDQKLIRTRKWQGAVMVLFLNKKAKVHAHTLAVTLLVLDDLESDTQVVSTPKALLLVSPYGLRFSRTTEM